MLSLTVYVGFGVVLKLLPGTQKLSELLFGQIMIPLSKGTSAIIGFLPNLLIIFIVIAISNYIMDFSRFFFREIEEGILNLMDFIQNLRCQPIKLFVF